mmetsp:Transcript_29006/g.55630  ORF Transcript_29006/g.55630 Transcript_29006/m.55630 type:complete len:220 (-) Transcript_29006:120-779(-)
MQRGSEVCGKKFLHGTRYDGLIVTTNTCHPDTYGLGRVCLLLAVRLHLQQLLDAGVDAHVPRRLVALLAPAQGLHVRLLHTDVKQAQGVQSHVAVLLDAIIETVWSPRVGEEDYGHGLAEAIQLQPACPHRIHDGCVVHNLHLHSQVLGTNDKVRVGSGSKGIPYYQETDVGLGCFHQYSINSRFHHFPIRHFHRASIKLFQLLIWAEQNGSVHLEIKL